MTVEKTASATSSPHSTSSSAAATSTRPSVRKPLASDDAFRYSPPPLLRRGASQHIADSPNIMKKNRSDVIKTIQEITKLDEFTINQAIEACQDNEGRYSMDQVLNILMDERYSNEYTQDSCTTPTKSPSSSGQTNCASSRQSDDGTESKYATGMARAVAASADSPSATRSHDYANSMYAQSAGLDEDDDEDYEAMTATTASSGVSSMSPSGAIGSALYDSQKLTGGLSESNLLREEGKPAGLKNVGNTCWFNSIIQAFFNLPYFRQLIFSFQIEPSEIIKLDENSRNVVHFVCELRKLFALMLKSKRKAINPNLTLRYLRNCSKYDVDTFNQEDVSEFATILVNLIEESFDVLAKLQQARPTFNDLLQLSDADFSVSSLINPTNSLDSLTRTFSTFNFNSIKDAAITKTSTPLSSIDEATTRAKNTKNPIVNLLNGDILINRKNSDENVTNDLMEVFREVNIQMLNARNLHAGLELEWGETSIDKLISAPLNVESTAKDGIPAIDAAETTTKPVELTDTPYAATMNKSFYEQESWVVKLPSVLFICLNRYKFVKATQSSSKIMEPFEFYPFIYLDRYMLKNRECVKEKRKQLKCLNSELKKLEEKLDSIKNYKFDSVANRSEYALDDVLKCALHFASTDYSLDDVFSTIKPLGGDNVASESTQLRNVQQCLQTWISQLESKLVSLKMQIAGIKQQITTLYEEPSLQNVKYNLHSVCIHEGSAMLGHFWTYVWNKQQAKWYKFNDTEVCESTWEDLYSNAVGGSYSTDTETTKSSNKVVSDRTPSAYFLIYTKAEDDAILYNENDEISVDLQKVLNEDKELLENQLTSLKLKHIARETTEKLKKSTQILNTAISNSPVAVSVDQNSSTCLEHAKAFMDSSFDAFAASFNRIMPNSYAVKANTEITNFGAEEALKNAVEIEMAKYNESVKDVQTKLPDVDVRTHHILTYLACNAVPRDIRLIALFDVFRTPVFSDNDIRLKILQTLAHAKFNEYLSASVTAQSSLAPPSPLGAPTTSPSVAGVVASVATNAADHMKTYEKWQADYRDFRSIIAAFINAANLMEQQKYEEATPFFCVTCEYNERLTANLLYKMKGMDHEFLLQSRRKCLKLWNQSAIRKFTNLMRQHHAASSHSDDYAKMNARRLSVDHFEESSMLIETMMNKFLPCLFRCANSTAEDRALVDEIRQDWLTILDSNAGDMQVFQDFMAKLFDDTLTNHYHSLNVNKNGLETRYRDTVQMLHRIKVKSGCV